MAWSTARQELRTALSDGDTDKLRYRKRVMGIQNGVNLKFKTFEFRRLASFVGATQPVGVFVNDAPVAVTADQLLSGEFELAAAPGDGDTLRATYYIQFFTDAELDDFLGQAAKWLGFGATFANIVEPLQPAAIAKACCQAYRKLAIRFAENMAEVYQLEDSPDEKKINPVENFRKLAADFCKEAEELRDDYYSRDGKRLAPRFSVVAGNVKDVPPNR